MNDDVDDVNTSTENNLTLTGHSTTLSTVQETDTCMQ